MVILFCISIICNTLLFTKSPCFHVTIYISLYSHNKVMKLKVDSYIYMAIHNLTQINQLIIYIINYKFGICQTYI